LADLFSGRAEIISADSMQVYRGMDIGTAKPSASVRSKITHHLLDIRDPDEQFTVGDFVKLTERLIGEITRRKKIPIVSGGTAYYFRNLLFGLPDAPPGDTDIRVRVENECAASGLDSMYRRLRGVDPESSDRISPRDRYRILRALEVYEAAGRPLSSFAVPQKAREDLRFLVIGLFRGREELYRRIENRVDAMFDEGLADEVSRLIGMGYRENAPGMRGIGYGEFLAMRRDGCLRLKDVKDLIKRNSRRYAKRQMTFFKTLPGVVWVHPDAAGEIVRLSREFYPCEIGGIG
jgi:tRNA dimethylallyltransferase